MIAMIAGSFRPLPFDSIMDRKTGRVRVRFVDIHSDRYMIARRYMLRLRKDDFDDEAAMAKLAAVVKLPVAEFRKQFEYLVADEPMPRSFVDESIGRSSPPPSVRVKTPSVRPKSS
ncbi:MAG: hypothetical protein NVSMB47_20890 [Polyangiales bacterium]